MTPDREILVQIFLGFFSLFLGFCLQVVSRGERICEEMDKFNDIDSGENARLVKRNPVVSPRCELTLEC